MSNRAALSGNRHKLRVHSYKIDEVVPSAMDDVILIKKVELINRSVVLVEYTDGTMAAYHAADLLALTPDRETLSDPTPK